MTLDAELEDIFTKIDALSLGQGRPAGQSDGRSLGCFGCCPGRRWLRCQLAVPAVVKRCGAEEKTEFNVVLKEAGRLRRSM